GRHINNPDQRSVAYMSFHGIPHDRFGEFGRFIARYSPHRRERNAAMARRVGEAFGRWGLTIDLERDVEPLSFRHEGGSVTERHLLLALARKVMEKAGKGPGTVLFLERDLGVGLGGKVRGYLSDPGNEHYEYDLLGALKGGLNDRIYLPAGPECPKVGEFVGFARETGSILTYAYLGDVAESVTGDKKAQAFEDGYLDLLFAELGRLGVKAVTYMPTRNTDAQIARVKALCAEHGLIEVCGEDINSPRQGFVCEEIGKPWLSNLIEAAWALIGHEAAATGDASAGFLGEAAVRGYPKLDERVAAFAGIGRGGYEYA
ncbi:MAG: PHP domain-containing protein, partial [Oscillospiraceae bacterium]|nr:PHP domain-containing protein [Oscillospiraceae bacterium]